MRVEVITDDAFGRLTDLSADASCIRAAMAYWTIPVDDLPSQFVQGLNNSNGFLCVDIHNPTSISALASLKTAGVDVCLHLVSTTGKSEIEDSTGMPNHLMHSKVIVFDYEGRDSIIWVGSHNGTFRALDGINFECALAVQINQNADLYREVLVHLGAIRSACQPFNVDLKEHYRFLQGGKLENIVNVMEFENENDQPLILNDEITVFNMSKEDFKSCKTVDAGICVSVHGSEELLYSARVVQTGETPAMGDQVFSVRRYADRYKADLPLLLGATAVTKEMYRKGTYYAIVKLEKKLDDACHLLEIPSQSAWVNVPANTIIRSEKPDADPKILAHQRNHNIKGLTFKVPAFEEMMQSDSVISREVSEFRLFAFKEVPLIEKKSIKNPNLIKRKLLIKR